MKKFRFSLLIIISIVVIFQFANLVYFVLLHVSNGRIINNLMIFFINVLYVFSLITNRSVLNKFQYFISSALLFSQKQFFDDIDSHNFTYIISLTIFNLIALYDVFYLKKE